MNYPMFLIRWRSFVSIGGLVFFLGACSSQPKNTFPLSKDQLTFGRGGGISGEVKTHILVNDGQLHATNSMFMDTVHLATLAPEVTRSIFTHLDSLQLDTIDFQHPGNRYYFIRHNQDEVVWGDQNYSPPASVQQFYDTLQRVVPKQN